MKKLNLRSDNALRLKPEAREWWEPRGVDATLPNLKQRPYDHDHNLP